MRELYLIIKYILEQSFAGGKRWKKLSPVLGGIVGISLGILTSVYVATLHENDLWFSNIKEVEREISFRTECGLYYSYYKQMLQAPSIQLGANFLEPVYFYIYTVFGLQAVYVIALYVTSWLLSGTWISGVLAAFWYITNRIDTTRVEFTIPLRENWALPFFANHLKAGGLFSRLGKLFLFILLVLSLTFLGNNFIKCTSASGAKPSSTSHDTASTISSPELCYINFLFFSFSFRDFDANLYLCEEAFGLLPFNTFMRLSDSLVFYAYVFVLFVMAITAAVTAFQNLRAHHSVRIAGFKHNEVSVIRYLTPMLILLYLCYKFWPGVMAELSELREFYDPDTVELMNWI
ncbi:hypothetical protein JD844_000331, partial [Phrynosoma platyrhinos]